VTYDYLLNMCTQVAHTVH